MTNEVLLLLIILNNLDFRKPTIIVSLKELWLFLLFNNATEITNHNQVFINTSKTLFVQNLV